MSTSPSIVIAADRSLRIGSRQDVSDALAASFGSDGLVLTEQDVSPDFFRLATGLAGELFQKFANYRIPVALVIRDFASHGERFTELAHEHAHHPAIRFVHSMADALGWLSTRPANRPQPNHHL
ncbi:DUF4180 domain-containing protein [Rhodanobacter hydrolyticus]|uniref:DUF4180 domain-containing protein n=1 Tax=Rhodanobacter hydrolyticus TaxID=2250595 RepID=A0ABW8J9X7_9GAMM